MLTGNIKDYYKNKINVNSAYLFEKNFIRSNNFKNMIFAWNLSVYDIENNQKSVLTSSDMDERLYYYSIVPIRKLNNGFVRAYDKNDNLVFSRKISSTDEIKFPSNIAENIKYVKLDMPFENNSKPEFHSFLDIQINTKLRPQKNDPDLLYDCWNLNRDYHFSTKFESKATLETTYSDKEIISERTSEVPIKIVKNEISASQDIERSTKEHLLSAGDSVIFTPQIFIEDPTVAFLAKDFKAISLLPDHVRVKNVLPAINNLKYEVIENYKNSGRTAVIFRCDSVLSKSYYAPSPFHQGRKIARIETFLDGSVKNETLDSYVAITAENGIDINRNIDNKDETLLDGYNWSKNIVQIRTFAVENLLFEEYIKDKDSLLNNTSAKLELNEDFNYVLNIYNKTNDSRKDISIISVLPNQEIKQLDSNVSEFKPEFDYNKGVQVSEGYSVYYLNTPFPDTPESIDKIDDTIHWDKTPGPYTSAVKIISKPGTVLSGKSSLAFNIPMSISNNLSLVDKKAYHSFFYKDNVSRDYSKSNKVTIEVSPILGDITFKKVGYDSNFAVLEPLKGVVFKLRYADGQIAKTAVSNQEGIVNFKNIDVSKDYFLQETHTLDDFYKDESKIYISSQDLFKAPNRVYKLKDIVNKRKATPLEFISGSLKFKKVNKSGVPLSQAEFTLTGISEWNKNIKLVEKSDKDGYVNFRSIPYGKYILTESAPPGSLMPIEPTKINIPSQNGNLDIGTIVNDKAAVKIIKVRVDKQPFGIPPYRFKDIYGDRLPDVKFNLYRDGKLLKSNLNTNENGELIIDNLDLDSLYTIKEQEAPKGYSKVYNEIYFQVNKNGELCNESKRRFVEPNIYIPNLIDGNINVVKLETSEEVADLPLNRLTGLEGKPLENVVFDLYEGEVLYRQGLTTDSKGKISLTELKYDTRYTLKEVKPLDGYVAINSEILY